MNLLPHTALPEPGAGVLRAAGLRYRIGSAELLSGVDFELKKGELVGLIGPNGAGKTTLLKTLIGFLKPSGGDVYLDGRPIGDYKARDRARRIAYLSQHGPDQFPFPVIEVVEMGAYPVVGLGRAPGKRERDAAHKALAYVGLEHLAYRSFPTLSGGERQLALFARVLVQESPIIILDEPTVSLDIGHEAALLNMVGDLCAEGRSAVVALHNLNLAAEHCHRLVLMERGTVRAVGTPEEVLTRELIETSYHTEVHVGRNESTGSVSIDPVPRNARRVSLRVHVIGGAGSGVNITRFLHRSGCFITGGVAHELDSDAKLWRALGIPFVTTAAFSEIDETAFHDAASLIAEADITVLCAFPFGKGNSRNLRLAAGARELIILEEEPGDCQRDFFVEPESTRAAFEDLIVKWGMKPYRDACVYFEKRISACEST